MQRWGVVYAGQYLIKTIEPILPLSAWIGVMLQGKRIKELGYTEETLMTELEKDKEAIYQH